MVIARSGRDSDRPPFVLGEPSARSTLTEAAATRGTRPTQGNPARSPVALAWRLRARRAFSPPSLRGELGGICLRSVSAAPTDNL
ncbi:hypothetical protein ACHAWF_016988 [Thalassiosira exigua]